MILSYQAIKALCGRKPHLIVPFTERAVAYGLTYGLGPAGYDVRIAENLSFVVGDFKLSSTLEHFWMPDDLLARVHDKSTWARKGLFVQNTVIEPGWHGFLTLELMYHGPQPLYLQSGTPIAQIIFERLEAPTEKPYNGRYQDQLAGPQEAIFVEEGTQNV